MHPHMSHLGWKTWNGTHRVLSKSQRLWVAYSPVWPDPTWLSNLISSCSLSRSPHCSSDTPGTALPHCLFWPLTPPESPSSIQMWQFLHFLRSMPLAPAPLLPASFFCIVLTTIRHTIGLIICRGHSSPRQCQSQKKMEFPCFIHCLVPST